MGKIKGWSKYDEYVWRRKQGNGYSYIWIASNNIVRVVDFNDKPRPQPAELTQQSYVMKKFSTLKQADKYVKNFMRGHPNG